ncbi:FtsX-like permease family protein [Streptomyces platensis]
MPVAVFIATAVRFGGERRDRRMAALRLVGTDRRMTRRMAAGEALCGALCGLALGAGLFLLARRFSGRITLWDVNAFPADVVPDPALAALIALVVPLCAVVVTLVALRGVTVEPLGVVRHQTPRSRRVWRRLPGARRGGATHRKVLDAFCSTKGVRGVTAVLYSTVSRPGGPAPASATPLTVGDCRGLRELARLDPCRDGDVFIVRDGSGAVGDGTLARTARPGAEVLFHGGPDVPRSTGRARRWTVPEEARTVTSRTGPAGTAVFGIFATPSAVPVPDLAAPVAEATLTPDPRVPDAAEYAHNTAARLDPAADVRTLRNTERDQEFATVRTGLLVASPVTPALIAASMLVGTLEQLRERRRLLSVLVAFGTGRAQLGWSVLCRLMRPEGLRTE